MGSLSVEAMADGFYCVDQSRTAEGGTGAAYRVTVPVSTITKPRM